MNGRFKYLKSREGCKVCGESGKGCRELDQSNGVLYFCRGENPSPDYHFLNYLCFLMGVIFDEFDCHKTS